MFSGFRFFNEPEISDSGPPQLKAHPRGLVFNIKFGLGGLRVTCLSQDPRFAGSNPAEVAGFYQDVKILSTSPSRRDLSCGS